MSKKVVTKKVGVIELDLATRRGASRSNGEWNFGSSLCLKAFSRGEAVEEIKTRAT